MASGIVSPFIRAIQETTGKRAPEFAETVLGLKYPTFIYRMRNGCLRYKDYLRIAEATRMSLDQIFKALGGESIFVTVSGPGFLGKPVSEITALDAVRNHMRDVIPRQQPPEQKKEPVEAPFVVEDLPLTMPGE